MTFQQMQCFIEVAHCRNFTKAAQNLYISQPNLTKYISGMERELGFRLFERSARKVELTPEGRNLLHRTEAIFSYLMRAVDDAKFQHHQIVHTVNIGISRDETIPLPMVETLWTLNSGKDQHITLEQDSYLSLISRLADRTYDLILTTDRNVRIRGDFEFAKLRPFALVIAIHKSHPKASIPDLSPSDLPGELIFMALPDGKSAPHDIVSSVYHNCGGKENEFDIHLCGSPRDTILNARINAGIAIVSGLVNRKEFPDIRFVDFEKRADAFQYLVWRKGEDDPAVLLCRDKITESCQPLA